MDCIIDYDLTEEAMAEKYDLVQYPDEILKQQCTEVADTKGMLEVTRKMLATMKHKGGIGLAAPQVGRLDRVIVVLVCDFEQERIGRRNLRMINPKILDADGAWERAEQCLSLPKLDAVLTRPERISVEYVTPQGEETVLKGVGGLTARAIQHEIDHLDGKLILDYATDEAREAMHAELGLPADFEW